MAQTLVLSGAPKDVTTLLSLKWHKSYKVQNVDSSDEAFWLIQETAPVIGTDPGHVLKPRETLDYRPKPANYTSDAALPASRLWMWPGNGSNRIVVSEPAHGT